MRGACLCGAVAWETDAVPRDPIACHCTQCRRQTGHYWAASQVPTQALRVAGEVRWFQASPTARRGFCPTCGSVLFWQPLADGAPGPAISFSLGGVEAPTGLRVQAHIFVGDKGDYYGIEDGPPRHEGDAG